MTLLFIVDDTFQISNRGCVLVPGPSLEAGVPHIRPGTPIRLQTPDGRIIDTHVRGVESLNYGSRRPERITTPILLPAEIHKEDVPSGTQVFALISEAGNG